MFEKKRCVSVRGCVRIEGVFEIVFERMSSRGSVGLLLDNSLPWNATGTYPARTLAIRAWVVSATLTYRQGVVKEGVYG